MAVHPASGACVASVASARAARPRRDDRAPTALGEAIATHGRIHESLHVLAFLDDEAYRRRINAQLNVQESRHALARRLFFANRGELRQAYREGQEDRIGALGLVLNAVVLFTTRYENAALDRLRAGGHPVLPDDVRRISPLVRRHANVHGRYSFQVPNLGGGLRPLRDPATAEDDFDHDPWR